jgi:hypothetical protein
MSSDPTGLFLVISNIAAIPAIVYALYRCLFPEATLIIIIAIVSFFYHMCQSDYWCLVSSDCQNKADFVIMQMMDEFFVFVVIIWFILYFFEIRLRYRIVLTFIIQTIIFIPIVRNVYILIFEAAIIGGIIIISIIILIFLSKKSISFYIFSTIVAIILIVVGFSLFIVAGDPDDSLYPWLHSVWHILLFIAILFVLDMKYGKTDTLIIRKKNSSRILIYMDY